MGRREGVRKFGSRWLVADGCTGFVSSAPLPFHQLSLLCVRASTCVCVPGNHTNPPGNWENYLERAKREYTTANVPQTEITEREKT